MLEHLNIFDLYHSFNSSSIVYQVFNSFFSLVHLLYHFQLAPVLVTTTYQPSFCKTTANSLTIFTTISFFHLIKSYTLLRLSHDNSSYSLFL
jgi:hypothetical protein